MCVYIYVYVYTHICIYIIYIYIYTYMIVCLRVCLFVSSGFFRCLVLLVGVCFVIVLWLVL